VSWAKHKFLTNRYCTPFPSSPYVATRKFLSYLITNSYLASIRTRGIMTRVPFMKTDFAELGRRASPNFRPRCSNKVTARLCPSRFYSNVKDSAWTWWYGMWVSDVHWKLRSTSKKKWTGERWGRFDDGMPLMGFSGDTGKDNSTQWYSRYCAIDNSSGGLTAADAAESSCRFPSRPNYLLPSARPEESGFGLALGRGKQKRAGSQCRINSTENFATVYCGRLSDSISNERTTTGAFYCY